MTDLTDNDLRHARQWAEGISSSRILNENARAAVRVILATVDAPAPTLSEEWRDMLEKQDAGEVVSFSGLLARTDQMERDLAEAHAEVERLDAVAEDYGRMATAALTERDEARAEVERLTTERLDRNPETKARVKAALNNIDKAETVTVQKGAESNAEPPDPADVKPGEAWKALIWYDDVRYPGTAIKSSGGDWVVIRDGGSHSTFRMNEYVELVSRLVPAPRVITNADDLDRLPRRAVILSTDGQADVYQKDSNGEWVDVASYGYPSRQVIRMENAVTVLWEPEA